MAPGGGREGAGDRFYPKKGIGVRIRVARLGILGAARCRGEGA